MIQGATEFLPISSSGHLKLGQHLLGWTEPNLLFDVVLHVGTLLSVMLFYRADIQMVLVDGWRGLTQGARERSLRQAIAPEGVRLALFVLLATLPTGLIGLGLESIIDPDTGPALITPVMVCGLLMVNGAILIANAYFLKRERRARRARASDPESSEDASPGFRLWAMTPAIALAIGVAQGMAVLPGLSRSGLTITVALALGVQRLHAARYSFLLSVPAIVGALILKLDPSLLKADLAQLLPFLFGAAAAAGVGYLCLVLLTRMLQRARFHHFAWYCWAVGILGLILL